MNGAHDVFDELAAGWALGALDADDAARFEVHLRGGCAVCERTLADYQHALVAVANDLRQAPPARVRHAVLTRVSDGAPRRSGRLRTVLVSATGLALAAGIAAVVTAGALRGRYEPQLERLAREADGLREQLAVQVGTVNDLRQRLLEQERTLTMVRAESTEQTRQLALLTDPASRVVELAGLPPSPSAQGRVIWNPRAGGLLVAVDLPPVPPGKTYELWAISGGKPLPAGLFTVDAQGKGTLTLSPLEGVSTVDVFAVTLEPEGGVPQPTGQMYLASKA
jgi:anti-sigma-K factor RskA